MGDKLTERRVLWLADCTGECAPLVGGKATGLGALLRAGLQVPAGFAVTTEAYREHVEHNGLAPELTRLLADCGTFEAQQQAADEIRALFEASQPAPALQEAILAAYENLSKADTPRGDQPTGLTPPSDSASAATPPSHLPTGLTPAGDSASAVISSSGMLPVAVRSSASDEDSTTASFAGQQETYLWILGGHDVLRHVLRCWASLFTPQAIAYRHQLRTPTTNLAMGVVIQQMVPAEAAGVMLTLDPITGDTASIFVEAAYGLGAAVVNGEVDPDRFVVDKNPLSIRSRTIGVKSIAYGFDSSAQSTRRADVAKHLQNQPCMTDAEVLQLASLGKQMEQTMGRPQDIEWAIDAARQVFLLQARPETVWSQKS